ncbi:hypothetical protein SPI_01685 [Niveomyces insectorum RCEF 264]|uniref:Dol-P-Man:Man(5)GlcNAc(2)-PP-Dol alpha-1,3-mannosyltransferase n=1 Tax=Niveomyces insectorum RCEF 264 TaxID=1081102 RepID=A0A167Z5A0_9HYPO|nr:hypothetical protein SPI_01685 [Niveomyces insectorum RCEF 264]
MSKLSAPLKALINAPFARPGPTPAPAHIADVYRSIARDAAKNNVGNRPWITLSAAATITLNSPEALAILHRVATATEGSTTASAAGAGAGAGLPPPEPPVPTAELIREVGLKCIGFNGIPRTINLLATLAASHPDLPVHILHSHYAQLFTDPPADGDGVSGTDGARGGLATVGRVLTSLVAIACLRAQTGVGPQVVSHVFGLRKALADGTWRPTADDDGGLEAGREQLCGRRRRRRGQRTRGCR